MNHPRARAGYLAAGLATALTVAGAAAVQAQGAGHPLRAERLSSAKSGVAAHANRFGFGPGQGLTARATTTTAPGSTVRFDRTYRGLPVVRGDFIVHLDAAGQLPLRRGPADHRAAVAACAPSVSKSAAASRPRPRASATPSRQSTARLAVYGTAPRLAAGLAGQHRRQGRAARRRDLRVGPHRPHAGQLADRRHRQGRRHRQDAVLRHGHAQRREEEEEVQAAGQHPRQAADPQRATTRAARASAPSSRTRQRLGQLHRDQRRDRGADAAYGLANTWDFYLNTFGRNGIADDGKAARGFVHYGTNYVNAFWSDGCFCMEFGDGSAASGISALTSLDVAGHEMSHGVTSRTARLIYSGESGGLNESTSDVMGTMVEWYANNGSDVPDYVIGEEIFRNYNPATNYIRRMDQPSMDGGSKDCWYAGIGGIDVHYSSGVGNHFFYLLSEGSGAKTINGIAYNSPTCDGSTITGIGHDKAAAIWYQALTAALGLHDQLRPGPRRHPAVRDRAVRRRQHRVQRGGGSLEGGERQLIRYR